MNDESKAQLAERDQSTVPLNQVPFTWKTLYAIANTEFVPRALRGKPNALLAAILTGREMGLGPMESMRSIDVIDGRPSPSVEWMVGRILEAGHLIWPTEQTAEKCTVKGIRFVETPSGDVREIEQEYTFSMEMAKRAGLGSKNNWKHYPEAMLYWRAAAQLARQLFPDILRSVKHTPDELGADVHPYGVLVEDLPDVPDGLEVPESEGELVDTDDVVDVDEVEAETDEVEADDWEWRPEVSGEDDKVAIARVRQYADTADLWADVHETIGNMDDWIDKTIPEIQTEIRFLFRALEALGVWQGNDVLHDELRRIGKSHLGDLKKDGLQRFCKNMVTKAATAVRNAP